MELDHIGDLAIRKGKDTLAGFRVPHFDLSIERRGKEFLARFVERDVFDGLRVSHEGSQAVSFVVDVP